MPEISAVRVPADFEQEFPGASRSASEVAVNLALAQAALIAQIERPAREAHGLSASAFQALAILDGAGEPVPGHVIAGRLLVSSASMTSLLDTLERRGLAERRPHPTDRRKILVHLTADGQRIVDQQLPVLHAVIAQAISTLPEDDREHLLTSLTTIRARVEQIASQPLPPRKPGSGAGPAMPAGRREGHTPMAADPEATRGRRVLSKDRMEGFSDGVFGFAITLLVLDVALRPPGTPLQQVLHAWPSYLAYVISFLTIGGAWLAHTALTDRLVRPSLLGSALDAYARHQDLYPPAQEGEELHSTQRKFLPVIIGYVIAILTGLALPAAAVALYFGIAVYLVVPFREAARVLRRRRSPRQ